MDTVTLGRTGITVSKNGFGALPIQRISKADACRLLRTAYDGGITWFDTAHFYTDSEEKIGAALSDVRDKIILSTKTMCQSTAQFNEELDTSLRSMKTDYIDVYQFHNLPVCPKPGDGSGLYEAMLEAKKAGKIRFIGLTNHRLGVAEKAIRSGLYDTIQFPFCYLSGEKELALVRLAKEQNVGFLAMKALSGGLITNSAAAYAFLAQFDSVLPLWGVQRDRELAEFLAYQNDPPRLTDELRAVIEEDRKALAGDFCRGCGYCMPCPAGIRINDCARMTLMLRRAPVAGYTTPQWKAEMEKIESCLHCGKCASKCPYGLDTPTLLRRNLDDFRAFVKEHNI